MKSAVEWKIALRYLFARKSHSAVNVISVISVAGVAVAAMATVCVLSVFNGFTQLAQGRLSVIDPDLRIESVHRSITSGSDSLAFCIRSLPEVDEAMPVLSAQALAVFGERQIPVTVKGVPDGYDKLSSLHEAIIDGDFTLTQGDYHGAVMSVGTAMQLGARPGYVTPLGVYVPRRVGRINPANPLASFRSDSLIVSGVYQVNQSEYDADMVMMPLEGVRDLLDYDSGEASAIEIRLAQGVSSERGREAVISLLGPDYRVLDRLQQEESSFRMISIEKWISFVMLAFILLIASFNVISTLAMIIIEKRDNLRTLRALGATPAMVSRIFLIEGWLISLFGGVIGVVAGVAISLAQQYGGFIRLGGDPTQMSINVYPVCVEWSDILAVLGLVALTGALIGWIASRFTRRV